MALAHQLTQPAQDIIFPNVDSLMDNVRYETQIRCQQFFISVVAGATTTIAPFAVAEKTKCCVNNLVLGALVPPMLYVGYKVGTYIFSKMPFHHRFHDEALKAELNPLIDRIKREPLENLENRLPDLEKFITNMIQYMENSHMAAHLSKEFKTELLKPLVEIEKQLNAVRIDKVFNAIKENGPGEQIPLLTQKEQQMFFELARNVQH